MIDDEWMKEIEAALAACRALLRKRWPELDDGDSFEPGVREPVVPKLSPRIDQIQRALPTPYYRLDVIARRGGKATIETKHTP